MTAGLFTDMIAPSMILLGSTVVVTSLAVSSTLTWCDFERWTIAVMFPRESSMYRVLR